MSVFRAAENRVPLARSANTGLSLVTDAHGRIVARAPVWSPEVLVAPLAPAGARTWYTRLGDWPGALSLATVVLLALAAAARSLTGRRGRS
jgi:apolipoprotein N-acyltransferase